MRKKDLSRDRQERLVPVDAYSGAYALVPPDVPIKLGFPGVDRTKLVQAEESLTLLDVISTRLPNPDLITRTADRREAVRSSQIEGTHSDMDDLLTYEATGSNEGMPPDVLVTKNYVTALEAGLKEVRLIGSGAINTDLIKTIHARLMTGVDYNGIPGTFREKQNWIGGGNIYDARFVPPPHDRLDECMRNLEGLLQYSITEEDQMVPSIVVRMAVAHAQFESIHPFIDGNGRVGRILLPLMLAAEGYPPAYLAGYLKSNQREYYDSLLDVQLKGNWARWLNFFSVGVDAAAKESMRTGAELEKVLERWKQTVAKLGLRSDSVIYKLPEFLIGTPVVSAHQTKDALKISFPSASAALGRLEEIGILVRAKQQLRNRIFIAREVVDILNRPTVSNRD